ncbi:efflux RND transporter periplasmic adaptor subunit [Thalassococcus sp. S3]|uniref:efflux RND transporter periplasmic adaptor subunit n=1 Tax=Thalassococcus sp. S3 TaxID=2017482 RepID=UPI0010241431|nr:efflux RND transporter periplasmic adaptor subunit [Thalassococcus sp. S3]QBF32660.1 efflux transporter periplasmic adaptor subunit [Thalassococcus sp. S3]
MSLVRQLLLSVVVLAVTLLLWVTYVPSAAAYLDRVGLLSLLGMEAPEQAETTSGGRGFGGSGPTQVIVAEVTERALDDRISAIGDGRAMRSVTIRSDAVGLITEVAIEAGSFVEEGALLARLEDEAERIALDRAQIVLDDARDDSERLERLRVTGAVTEVSLREAQLAVRTAELALREAQFNLDQRRIVAPIAGWVGILEVEQGDRVETQDMLATITDRSFIVIDFRVPERVIGQLATGMEVSVTPLARRDTVLTGRISALDTVVDRASRTLRVQARVANDSDRLRGGMAFSVRMQLEGETLLAVDPLAVQWSGTGAFVWAVREGRVERVAVEIRQRNSDVVVIDASGLEPGDQVVTEGVQFLRPGAEVTVANDLQAAETPRRRAL